MNKESEIQEPLLQVKDLTVSFSVEGITNVAVDNISFDIKRGEVLGLVGESGSGKSVTGLSTIRLVPSPPSKRESGEVWFEGKDLMRLSTEEMRKVRGNDISVIFQEPMTAFSPLMTIGNQLEEVLRWHNPEMSDAEREERVIESLDSVGIPNAKTRKDEYPFQYSGGMRQRAMIAMALLCEPKLIIADEPTTALDVTLQSQVFDLLMEKKSIDTSILFITHDMGVVWELCDRVLVMKSGKIIERADTIDLFKSPQEQYTKDLLAAVPRLTDESIRGEENREDDVPLLEGKGIKTWFPVRSGFFSRVTDHIKAVDGVDLKIHVGEVVGLVGESGSGKTTLGRAILGLDKMRSGDLYYRGEKMSSMSRAKRQDVNKKMQMIFQDPYSALNPRMTVSQILTEGLKAHGLLEGSVKDMASYWLEQVELDPNMRNRYPHEFSGGQRQRICIARSVAMRPELIVCDECVSALDVSIQFRVIDLLIKLGEKFDLSYLFISHDMSVVKRISDRVIVMKEGKVVEEGSPSDVIESPSDSYTKRLMSSIPIPGDLSKRRAR